MPPHAPRSAAAAPSAGCRAGSARVKVYAGVDQLTGQEIWLRETVKARATRRETEREAEKVVTKLTNQVDERRSPKTEATVNELPARTW